MQHTTRFDDEYKNIDISNIDLDSESFDRKYLEITHRYERNIEAVSSMFQKEWDLANNYGEEIERRTKLQNISDDFRMNTERLTDNYINEVNEAIEKYEKKKDYPYYFKMIFRGNSKDYDRLFNGLSYYVKQLSENRIQVYNDVKFNSYLGEFDFIRDDWKDITLGDN